MSQANPFQRGTAGDAFFRMSFQSYQEALIGSSIIDNCIPEANGSDSYQGLVNTPLMNT